MSPASLKSRLAAGETLFGTMVFEFDSPGLARIVAGAGADFIILDMEHSGWGGGRIKRQTSHPPGAGLPPTVNPPGDPQDQICRPPDPGAIGGMAPGAATRARPEPLVG